MTGRLACVTSQDVGCVGRRRPGGPALSGLLSLRGSGRLVQRHERLSLRSPRSSGRERGLRAAGLVACRRSSFFRLLVQSSVPSCAPVVVKREPISSSCGDSLVRRARPAPGSAHAHSLVLDLNAGRRAPPAVRGRLRRDAAAAAAGNGRSGVGRVFESRRRPAFRCRAASVAMFALPRAGVRSSGTSPDRRRRYCAASARSSPSGGRYAFHGVRSDPTRGPSQPAVLPSAASTRAWSAVARKSASDRVQIAVTAGRARACSRRSRSTAHARRRAFARHPPGGRTNMLPQGSSTRCLRAAGSGTDSRLPRCRFINDRRPRLLTFSSISVLLSPVSPSSRYFLLCGPVRPPGGRYLSGTGSLRSAPVGRANMLPSRGSTRCLRAAGSGTDSRLPRCRLTNDRRPRLLTLPSIVRPPLSRFTVFSLFPPLWSCPAARRPVSQ